MGEFLCIMAVAFMIAILICIFVAVNEINKNSKGSTPQYKVVHYEDEELSELLNQEDEDEEDDEEDED